MRILILFLLFMTSFVVAQECRIESVYDKSKLVDPSVYRRVKLCSNAQSGKVCTSFEPILQENEEGSGYRYYWSSLYSTDYQGNIVGDSFSDTSGWFYYKVVEKEICDSKPQMCPKLDDKSNQCIDNLVSKTSAKAGERWGADYHCGHKVTSSLYTLACGKVYPNGDMSYDTIGGSCKLSYEDKECENQEEPEPPEEPEKPDVPCFTNLENCDIPPELPDPKDPIVDPNNPDGNGEGNGNGNGEGSGNGNGEGNGNGNGEGNGNGNGEGSGSNYDKDDLTCKGSNCTGSNVHGGSLPSGSATDLYQPQNDDNLADFLLTNVPDVNTTKIGAELNKLIPVLPVGTCPSFYIKGFSLMGTVLMNDEDVSIPCWVYDLIRAFLQIGAVVYARKIIFGA